MHPNQRKELMQLKPKTKRRHQTREIDPHRPRPPHPPFPNRPRPSRSESTSMPYCTSRPIAIGKRAKMWILPLMTININTTSNTTIKIKSRTIKEVIMTMPPKPKPQPHNHPIPMHIHIPHHPKNGTTSSKSTTWPCTGTTTHRASSPNPTCFNIPSINYPSIKC